MNWDIIAYGSGDFLRMVFTALASIFGNDDYMGALRIAALLAVIAILFRAAFDQKILAGFQWMMGMLVVLLVCVVPKGTVIINDRIIPANSAVVNNVPLGLAATASFFSFTGDWLTRAFETVFSMPSEVQYSTSGLLFPHKLYEGTRHFSFPDARTESNFIEFFSSCVVVDGLGHNRFSWRDVLEATDLIDFFSNNVAVNAASFKYTDSTGTESILACRDGFTNYLVDDMENLYSNIIAYGVKGGFVGRFGSVAAAEAKIDTDMSAALSFMTGISQTAEDTTTQMAIINAMGKASQRLSSEVGAAEFNNYIVSGANAERLTAYQAIGNIASEKLPLLRALFEAFIYAIFPIIVMMAIVVPGKVPLAYLMALVWINLWAPIYAILHFAMSYYSQASLTSLAAAHGGGFSVLANSYMAEQNADIVATTGFLATGLPLLAWMLLSRSGALAASFAGRVMQGYEKSVEQGTGDVMAGAGTRQGASWQMANSDGGGFAGIQSSYTNEYGSRVTSTAGGEIFVQQDSSKLLMSSAFAEQATQAKRQDYDRAVSAQEGARSAANEASASLLNTSLSVMKDLRADYGSTTNWKTAESSMEQKTFTEIENAAHEYQKTTGNTLSDAAKLHVYGELGVGGELLVKAKAGVGFTGEGSSVDSEAAQEARKFMDSDQFSKVVSVVGTGAKELAASVGLKKGDAEVDSIEAAQNKSTSAQLEYSNAVMDTTTAKEAFVRAEQMSAALNVDGSQTVLKAVMDMPGVGRNADVADNLIRQAAGGNKEAFEQVRFAVMDADERFNLGNDPEFSKVMDALKGEGQSDVDKRYTDGQQNVDAAESRREGEVQGRSKVTEKEVDTGVNAAFISALDALDKPGSAIVAANGEDIESKRLEMNFNAEGTTVNPVEEKTKGMELNDKTVEKIQAAGKVVKEKVDGLQDQFFGGDKD